MDAPALILLVEDDDAHAELVRRACAGHQELRLLVARSLAEARAALEHTDPDVIVADLKLPDGRGIELVPAEAERAPYPVLIMTSHGDESIAVEAMKAGALDYIVKSAALFDYMPRVVARALREWRLVQERRRAEQELALRERELRHAQKMEAIGRLASGVAHDFNNALMGILGCADLALSKLPPDADAVRYIEELRRAAMSGASIARSLLAFGRRPEGDARVFDLDETVHATLDMLRLAIGGGVTLEVDLRAAGAFVRLAAGELEQIVLNLAINARDAMPGGGRLAIRSACTDASVVLAISDTGMGMDEDTRARVFEPFFTTKEPGKGTGLGLAMVYAIVTQRGGTITVSSRPGRGTTFEIQLPRAAEAPPAPEPEHEREPAELPRAAPALVLVVEDDALVRRAARHHLTNQGHRVLEAEDAAGARRVWREHGAKIDLLLTDVGLAGVSGPEIAAELRAARPDLPIIFMSAHAPGVLEGERRLPPGAVLLEKPFTAAGLAARMVALRQAAPAPTPAAVLLVEDNGPARLATAELLRSYDIAVYEAEGARAARELWRAHGRDIDVVVADLSLGDGRGGDLVAELRASRPELAAVYISGRSLADPEIQALLRAPRSAFVGKPVSIDDLVAQIRRLAAADAGAARAAGP